ncbi:Receptor-type guanylate cyclase gcy [Seminavis robusta]|uniref:Receptor-type guanylate cyclase gcy n=1 Tax=Seminavis robusta TaxID=568900 RepID=A0A9N8H7I4_9STRA|nr:Receptor-type guanylate cyclase gcy [Seminavis robusta]|eukprot:Sro141_g065940.1 Receptor-type guanylate cyclase gcy (1184) ;mRNA; f:91463-96163
MKPSMKSIETADDWSDKDHDDNMDKLQDSWKDDEEVDYHHSSSHMSNRTDDSTFSDSGHELAKGETRAVLGLRVVVILVLICAAIAITLVVWFTTTKTQDDDLASNFEGAATKLLESFRQIVDTKLGAVAGLSQRSASTRSLSGVLFFELLPFVSIENRETWEEYSVANKGWLDEGRAYQKSIGMDLFALAGDELSSSTSHNVDGVTRRLAESELNFTTGASGDSPIADKIWMFHEETFEPVSDYSEGPWFPIWQSSPVLKAPRDLSNWNVLHFPAYGNYLAFAAETAQAVIGGMATSPPGDMNHNDLTTSFFAYIASYTAGEPVEYAGDPFSSFYIPVFDTFDEDRQLVAVILGVLQWADYFIDVLPPNLPPVAVVIENTCEGAFSFEVSADEVTYLGPGDLHDERYQDMTQSSGFNSVIKQGSLELGLNQSLCEYTLHVYPTEEFHNEYKDHMPLFITLSVAAVFCFVVFLFLLYDRLVERRQKVVMTTATQQNAIVSSLFPSQIKDRLLEAQGSGDASKGMALSQNGDAMGRPLADLFLETTVLFADISGFTAWSSIREPTMVFTLLEKLYSEFDKIAKRWRVFKVETVGDCYVAVAGLPEANPKHAVVVARCAADIVKKMKTLTRDLEISLGGGTGELGLRVGIHSGPVTAGVLRGDRARFQLFGDTMNCCSRIETSGEAGRIHCSMETAELLKKEGKEAWLEKRAGGCHLKGLGEIETYWININTSPRYGDGSSRESESDAVTMQEGALYGMNEKKQRLILYNVDLLLNLMKNVVAQRGTGSKKQATNSTIKRSSSHDGSTPIEPRTLPLDEVAEIIHLPDKPSAQQNPANVVIPKEVEDELRDLVTTIAGMYRDNAFHSFEHASHVLMAVHKLMSRIVAPVSFNPSAVKDEKEMYSALHDNTFGITSDPITQFACAFSALIHDVDHVGVSNAQLVKEGVPIAKLYKERSVAEQNSLDLSWNLLMSDRFTKLRELLFPTRQDRLHFRQLVVNSVMATDIVDKDLKQLRNNRWDVAFKKGEGADHVDENPKDEVNRKATIVIEHIIQAADISHTMQHWHVYRRWNQNLFEELYVAYLNGRMEKDPATFWHKGEIGFFDFYIIPLTKKLKECGVFGVSSGEFLNYAIANRAEWVLKGEGIVEEMILTVRKKYGDKETGLKSSARSDEVRASSLGVGGMAP